MQNITWMTLVRYSLFFATGKLNEIQRIAAKKTFLETKKNKEKIMWQRNFDELLIINGLSQRVGDYVDVKATRYKRKVRRLLTHKKTRARGSHRSPVYKLAL